MYDFNSVARRSTAHHTGRVPRPPKKVLTPRDRCRAIAVMQDQSAISQWWACYLVGLSRPVMNYRSAKQRSDARVQGSLRELAAERKRFGSTATLWVSRGNVDRKEKPVWRLDAD